MIEPYWAPQNQLLCDHYKDVDIPFTPVETPEVSMQMDWSFDEFIDFIQSFSASRRFVDALGNEFWDIAISKLSKYWPDHHEKRQVDLEFVWYVGIFKD